MTRPRRFVPAKPAGCGPLCRYPWRDHLPSCAVILAATAAAEEQAIADSDQAAERMPEQEATP